MNRRCYKNLAGKVLFGHFAFNSPQSYYMIKLNLYMPSAESWLISDKNLCKKVISAPQHLKSFSCFNLVRSSAN